MKKAKIDIERAKLRQKSEELLKSNPKENVNPISETEVLKLIHELQVHQIELELQNKELINATKAAQIATEKYVELYDFALFGFFTLSKEGEILALNFNGAKMLGKNRSELINRRFVLFTSDDSKPIFISFCEKIISSKVKESCDVEILNNSSSATYLHLSGVIKENDDQLFVMALDITSQKLAEIEIIKAKEKAEESEITFRKLFEESSDPILLIDNKGVFVECNQAALNILKMTREQFLFQAPGNISPEYQPNGRKSEEAATEMINLAYKKGLHRFDWTHINAEGDEFIVAISLMPLQVKGQTMLHTTWRDITERKLAEEALIDSVQKYSEMANLLPQLLVEINLAGEITYVNHQSLTMFGYTEDELIGKSSLLAHAPEQRELIKENIKLKYAGHEFKSREFKMLRKDGSIFPALIFTGIIYQNNKPSGLRAIVIDISDQKRVEQELIAAKEKAEESEIKQRMQKQEIELSNERLESLLRISQLHTDSIQELLDFALNEAINLTYSKIGYIYFYNENTKQFSLNTWSKDVMKECEVMNPQTIYDLDATGCWGEAVRQRKPIVINNYLSENPLKKGTPHGHVKLSKFLTIPVIFDDKIVAVAGVANKESDYDDSDIRQLTLLMDNVWKISERLMLIEDLKKAKKETEESEQRLKLATSSGELGIWDWNVKENIMIWDECMFQLYGVKKTTFVNTFDVWVNGLHPEDKERAIGESNAALAGGKEFDTTFRVLHPNGTVRFLKADAVVIRDNNKKAIRMIGINKDVTENILAEQSLKTSETQLKEINATKDKLFSIIAHDLRSPFNSILGFSELLSENIKEFNIEESKRYSGIINSTAQNSLILLDNLLNWAKSQTGNLGIMPEKISLTKVILEVIQLNQLLAKPKNITLNYLPSDEFEVYSDENMLRLVFRNLISNAIKFTNPGGNISISVISVQNYIEISVSDNGVGMSDETCKKLFDIATNTTSPGTANEKGSGLGLVLCKEFVEKLGGKIWVESEVGVGSQFYFTIPSQNAKNKNEEASGEESIQQSKLLNKKLKILIAEDDKFSFQHLSIILKDTAKEIIHAKNGIEAVDFCRKNPDIDIMLMDIKMPQLNGYEATQRIREFNKEVIIIAQTAFALAGDENKAIEAGCNDYINKPIDKDRLIKKITTLLKAES